jgi:hypothetical protein
MKKFNSKSLTTKLLFGIVALFSVLIISNLISFYLINKSDQKIMEVMLPSISKTKELNKEVNSSIKYSYKWVYETSLDNTKSFKSSISKIEKLKKEINDLSESWDAVWLINAKSKIWKEIDNLLVAEKELSKVLKSPYDYSDDIKIDKAISGYKDMSNEQLIEFFTIYEMGEYVTTEEEMDYLMSRIGDWMGYRPDFYTFELSRKQLKELENQPQSQKHKVFVLLFLLVLVHVL